MIPLDEYVCDNKRNAEDRKAFLLRVSQRDLQRAFNLTLNLYRTVQTWSFFKGYDKGFHMKQNTEFLFFRDTLQQNIYKHSLRHKKDCLSKLETLRDEKNLSNVVKNELTDICSFLAKNKNSIHCYDMPETYLTNAEALCRINGFSLDDVMEMAITEYIATHHKKNTKRKKSHNK